MDFNWTRTHDAFWCYYKQKLEVLIPSTRQNEMKDKKKIKFLQLYIYTSTINKNSFLFRCRLAFSISGHCTRQIQALEMNVQTCFTLNFYVSLFPANS